MNRFNLIREYDDGDSLLLGTIKTNKSYRTITDAWEEFKDSEPDCDSQFIQFLVEHYGCIEIVDKNINIYLG
jgi:hypothetical protein